MPSKDSFPSFMKILILPPRTELIYSAIQRHENNVETRTIEKDFFRNFPYILASSTDLA